MNSATGVEKIETNTSMKKVEDGWLPSWCRDPFAVIFAFALILYTALTMPSLSQPLLDQHAFRQSQTAISAEWMANDLNPLRMPYYETPVFGAPWRVPFEFPIFQWLSAVLHVVSGMAIGTACRTVSVVMHLACLFPLWRLAAPVAEMMNSAKPAATVRRRLFWVVGSLFLLSPILLYWSRASLIESTALYCGLEYLAAQMRWTRTGAWPSFVAAVFFSAAACLIKITTFPPFAAAAMLDAIYAVLRRQPPRLASRVLGWRLVASVVPLAVSYCAIASWVSFADGQKMLNPLAAGTTSAALHRWNYGTWQQRCSGELWIDTVLLRGVPEAIGWVGPIIFLCGVAAARPATRGIALACGVLFLIPLLMFTNLHIRHNYYQYAVASWLVVAVAVVVTDASHRFSQRLIAVLLLAVLCGGGVVYARHYLPWQFASFKNDVRLVAMQAVKALTDPSDAVVFFGCDWSSEYPFHAKRRGIAVTAGTASGMQKAIDQLPSLLARRQLGAVVVLRNSTFDRDAGWDPDCIPIMLTLGRECAGDNAPVEVGPFVIFAARSSSIQ